MRSIEVYASNGASHKTRAFVIRNIVNPIVAMNVLRISRHASFEEPQLLDNAVIELIRTKIWMVNDSESQHGINHATMEMLQG